MKAFSGQVASNGFALGSALVLRSVEVKPRDQASRGAAAETQAFDQALARATSDLQRMRSSAEAAKKTQSVEILDAHLILLEDPEAGDQSRERIQSGQSAERAYYDVIEEFRQMFLQIEDEVIRHRAVDLHDLRTRVMFYLQNPDANFPDLELNTPTILIARDLTPSQILGVRRENLLGFLTVEGGSTSHTAILARSLEIPAVVGADTSVLQLQTGVEVALDGEKGQLLAGLTAESKQQFLKQKEKYESKLNEQARFHGQPSVTSDGKKLTLAANIAGPHDLNSFRKNDAESVGLYRTEFLFLDRDLAPSEDEQCSVYKEVFDGLDGKHVLVRTLDIGGDKQAAYLNMKHEENPFLGVRALRLCFQRPDIFKTQLRALLRAGAGADWGLMFPMVSQLEELLKAKAILEEVKSELRAEKKYFSEKFQVGIMIEIPSAAWMMPVLAPHVDFVSIGTNDLLQYTCAADRLNPDLKDIYNPFNVGFLRQMHFVLSTCADKKVHVGICGSLSHHPQLMAFFVGCGVDELSMTAQHILPTRARLSEMSFSGCRELVQKVLNCSTSAEVQQLFS